MTTSIYHSLLSDCGYNVLRSLKFLQPWLPYRDGLCPQPKWTLSSLHCLCQISLQQHTKVLRQGPKSYVWPTSLENKLKVFPIRKTCLRIHFHSLELFLSLDCWSHISPPHRWWSEKTWWRVKIHLLNGPGMRVMWKSLNKVSRTEQSEQIHKLSNNNNSILHFSCLYDMRIW